MTFRPISGVSSSKNVSQNQWTVPETKSASRYPAGGHHGRQMDRHRREQQAGRRQRARLDDGQDDRLIGLDRTRGSSH